MSNFTSVTSVLLQAFFIHAFILILIPLPFPKRKSLLIILYGITPLSILSGYIAITYSVSFITPLIIGLPSYCVICFLSDMKGFRFIFIVLSAAVFHQILATLLIVFSVYTDISFFLYLLINILSFGTLLYGGYYFRTEFHKIVYAYNYEFSYLSIILIIIYILNYIFIPFIAPNEIDNELFLFSLFIYFLFALLYVYIMISFRNLSQRVDAEHEASLLRMRMEETQNQITLLKVSQEKTAIYRHDLRHHFLLIQQLLENGEFSKIQEYLSETLNTMEQSIPKFYCQNETANLIISSYVQKAEKVNVALEANTYIPQSLTMKNTELCTLLSNALENAITATQNITDGREKIVSFMAKVSDRKLLISVENPYSGDIQLENGMPLSQRIGHGLGTKSIKTIVEKYGGLFSFETKNGVFILRIII